MRIMSVENGVCGACAKKDARSCRVRRPEAAWLGRELPIAPSTEHQQVLRPCFYICLSLSHEKPQKTRAICGL